MIKKPIGVPTITWSLKGTYGDNRQTVVASCQPGKIARLLDRMVSEYENFELTELVYSKCFRYKLV